MTDFPRVMHRLSDNLVDQWHGRGIRAPSERSTMIIQERHRPEPRSGRLVDNSGDELGDNLGTTRG